MKIKMFQASIASIMWRFYLLMAIVIIGVFTYQTWLFILGYAILATCLLGLKFEWKNKDEKSGSQKPNNVTYRITPYKKAG